MIAAGGLALLCGLLVLIGAPASDSLAPASDLLKPLATVGVVFGLLLMIGGLLVVVFGPVVAGHPADGFGSHRVVLATTALATLLAMLLSNLGPVVLLGLTGQRGPRNVAGFLTAALSVSLVLLILSYLRFLRPGVVSLDDFGFTRNRLAKRFYGQVWLANVVTGLGGGLLVLMLSAAIQGIMRAAGVEQTQLREFSWVRGQPASDFVLILMAGAVIGPIGEEIFFRGIVFRSYLTAKGPRVAYLASATVFALLHLNVQAFPPILVLGLVLAWVYRSTGSLTPSLLAHAVNNGVALLALYLTPPGVGPGGS